MDAAAITAFFTGIAALLGVIFKQQLELRKLKAPDRQSNLDNERAICNERVASIEAENEALRQSLQSEIPVPFAILTLAGTFVHASHGFVQGNPDDVLNTDGKAMMRPAQWYAMQTGIQAAVNTGAYSNLDLYIEKRGNVLVVRKLP